MIRITKKMLDTAKKYVREGRLKKSTATFSGDMVVEIGAMLIELDLLRKVETATRDLIVNNEKWNTDICGNGSSMQTLTREGTKPGSDRKLGKLLEKWDSMEQVIKERQKRAFAELDAYRNKRKNK